MADLQRFLLRAQHSAAWLRPPRFSDDAQTNRQVALLNSVSLIGLAVTLFYGVFWVVFLRDLYGRLPLVVMPVVVFGGVFVLVRVGRWRLAIHLLLAGTWLIITVTSGTAGGVRAPFFGFYTVCVLNAALYLGWRAAISYSALTVMTGLGMVVLANMGVIGEPFSSPLNAWLTQISIMLFVMLVGYVLIADAKKLLAQTQQALVQQEQTEAALRESEQRYRLISQAASDYAFSYQVREDGTLVLEWVTEESFLSITGVRREEFENTISLYHPDDMPRVAQDLRELLAGTPHEREYRILNRAGELRWIRMTRNPIRDA